MLGNAARVQPLARAQSVLTDAVEPRQTEGRSDVLELLGQGVWGGLEMEPEEGMKDAQGGKGKGRGERGRERGKRQAGR